MVNNWEKITSLDGVDFKKQVVLVAKQGEPTMFVGPRERLCEDSPVIKAMVEGDDATRTQADPTEIPDPEKGPAPTKLEEGTPVELEDVDGPTLELIMEYMKTHEARPAPRIPMPLRRPWADYVTEYQKSYVVGKLVNPANLVDNVRLFNVYNAAIFLEFEPLMHLCAAYIADLIKDKSVSQIRELLHITERHPPEIEAEMIKDFKELFPDHAAMFD